MKKPVGQVKPQPVAVPRLDFGEVMDYLESKYGFDHRDYLNSFSHFGNWADSKGYTMNTLDPEGKQRSSSQIWWKEYQNDPAGAQACPEYQDFWHWLLDYSLDDIHKGADFTLYLEDALEDSKVPDWVKTILGYIKVEFAENGEPELEFNVWW
jgi:hypothetical protein